ncbi:MAG: transposase [Boseongicola sp. SB0665_bin_10]|nr:transposase [Boseongicola sp. SB0665_bin_10]
MEAAWRQPALHGPGERAEDRPGRGPETGRIRLQRRAAGPAPARQGLRRLHPPREGGRSTGLSALPQRGLRVGDGLVCREGRLRLVGVPGLARVRWHRELPARPVHAIVSRSNGKRCVTLRFKVRELRLPGEEDTRPDVGVDVGLNGIVATGDGMTVPAPKHARKAQARTQRLQRALARKERRTERRARARRNLARHHGRVAARRDFLRKLSHGLAPRHRVIAMEDLNMEALKRSMPARPVPDAAWTRFRDMPGWKRRWLRGPGRPARHLPAMQRMRARAGQTEDAWRQGARLRRLRPRPGPAQSPGRLQAPLRLSWRAAMPEHMRAIGSRQGQEGSAAIWQAAFVVQGCADAEPEELDARVCPSDRAWTQLFLRTLELRVKWLMRRCLAPMLFEDDSPQAPGRSGNRRWRETRARKARRPGPT